MESFLKQFGLSDPEILVYKTLLTSGGAKVSDIAKTTKIKRTSCQEYVRSLEEKGFVNAAKIGKKHFYQSEDPDRFRQIIYERQYLADRLIPELGSYTEEDEWSVRALDAQAVYEKVKRAKKKKTGAPLFGDSKTGSAWIDAETIVLWSPDKELPAIEITSKNIAALHQHLLKPHASK